MRPWFEQIGMKVNVDAAGNLRAVYTSETGQSSPVLIIGSHLDTVPNAGAYDGVLGVLLGLALVEGLGGRRLPYSIEIVGFSDEEGTRFGFPFIGSRLLTEEPSETGFLESQDSSGVTIRQALANYRLVHPEVIPSTLNPETAAYLEFHIEQGPVLESQKSSVRRGGISSWTESLPRHLSWDRRTRRYFTDGNETRCIGGRSPLDHAV